MSRRSLTIIAVLVLVSVAGALSWHALSPTPSVRQGPRVVDVPAHVGVVGIARDLRDAGVVRTAWGFVAVAWARGTARSLKAGEYEVERGSSLLRVLALIESGRVKPHTILHPEGATVAELARVLEAERLASAADVLGVASDPVFLRAQGIDAPSAEGYLFPDRYQFVRGLTVSEMLGRMVQRLRVKLGPDLRARAAQRGLTVNQLLTLASIVEREAVAPEETRVISAVFWNRLRRGMPLQADPTVQYATGKARSTLTHADLLVDSPYNTYRYTGLPPGPIDSPGLRAIQAVLDPAPVDYLYFVAVDHRTHHFSRTLAEHNRAVTRYRLARSR